MLTTQKKVAKNESLTKDIAFNVSSWTFFTLIITILVFSDIFQYFWCIPSRGPLSFCQSVSLSLVDWFAET